MTSRGRRFSKASFGSRIIGEFAFPMVSGLPVVARDLSAFATNPAPRFVSAASKTAQSTRSDHQRIYFHPRSSVADNAYARSTPAAHALLLAGDRGSLLFVFLRLQ